MIAFSHDPDAGTIYCYFTELTEGQVSYDLEYPAALLLDQAGAIIGFRLDLDDEITLDQLELILDEPHTGLDMQTGYLRVAISDEEPAREVKLAATAIIDLDDEGRILGADIALEGDHQQEAALARLAPLMVELDDAPTGPDGPVVFAIPTAQAEEEEYDDEDADDEAADDHDLEAEALDDQEEFEAEEDDDSAELDEPELDEPELQEAGAMSAPLIAVPEGQFRSGYVALVGKPNVGKSTLLNRLLGQKISIVSPRPQTTRVPVRGILHRPDSQVVFIDTPGIHTPRHKLGTFMVETARRAIPDADVICMMVDISKPPSNLDIRIANELRRARGPRLLVLNKVDVRNQGQTFLEAYRDLSDWDMELAISARRGLGLETLLEEIIRRLPLGAPLYPTDQVSDQTERQIAGELVREQVLYNIEQEVPHSVAVEVDEWEEKENATYIRMSINVEKESQKGILIGSGGAMLKKIGSAARLQIERLLGRKVFLELWVKARPNWRDDASSLNWLGYRAKDWR